MPGWEAVRMELRRFRRAVFVVGAVIGLVPFIVDCLTWKGCSVISGFFLPNLFWVRVFGLGISCKNTGVYPLTFSERYGHRKGVRLGKWIFHFLKP